MTAAQACLHWLQLRDTSVLVNLAQVTHIEWTADQGAIVHLANGRLIPTSSADAATLAQQLSVQLDSEPGDG